MATSAALLGARRWPSAPGITRRCRRHPPCLISSVHAEQRDHPSRQPVTGPRTTRPRTGAGSPDASPGVGRGTDDHCARPRGRRVRYVVGVVLAPRPARVLPGEQPHHRPARRARGGPRRLPVRENHHDIRTGPRPQRPGETRAQIRTPTAHQGNALGTAQRVRDPGGRVARQDADQVPAAADGAGDGGDLKERAAQFGVADRTGGGARCRRSARIRAASSRPWAHAAERRLRSTSMPAAAHAPAQSPTERRVVAVSIMEGGTANSRTRSQ